jgi:hypothetical protein
VVRFLQTIFFNLRETKPFEDAARLNEDPEDTSEPELAPFEQSTTNLPPIMAYSYDGKPVIIGRRAPRNTGVPKVNISISSIYRDLI